MGIYGAPLQKWWTGRTNSRPPQAGNGLSCAITPDKGMTAREE
ncbi:hypothetical protein [Komagataeibacter medellinensis]|nr:hypothetical protein [Komagataeibacter medellinensis]